MSDGPIESQRAAQQETKQEQKVAIMFSYAYAALFADIYTAPITDDHDEAQQALQIQLEGWVRQYESETPEAGIVSQKFIVRTILSDPTWLEYLSREETLLKLRVHFAQAANKPDKVITLRTITPEDPKSEKVLVNALSKFLSTYCEIEQSDQMHGIKTKAGIARVRENAMSYPPDQMIQRVKLREPYNLNMIQEIAATFVQYAQERLDAGQLDRPLSWKRIQQILENRLENPESPLFSEQLSVPTIKSLKDHYESNKPARVYYDWYLKQMNLRLK